MKLSQSASPKIFTFNDFLNYAKDLQNRGINVSNTAGKCAHDYNTNWHNLQGHVKQAFYGVQRFLQENPVFIARIAQGDINSPYAITGNVRKAWNSFLKTHRGERGSDYDLGVLYNQTPVDYGGRTTSGGGGITYVRRSFPIVSRMVLSGPFADPDLLIEPEGESSKKEIRIRKETILRRVRDTETIRQLKKVYDYSCQVCRAQVIQIGPKEYYVEGHHLRPLGKPHNGEDHRTNIIILCPNHHVMFDRNVMAIDPKDNKSVICKFSKTRTQLLRRHKIDPDNIRYHYQSYISS